MTATTEQSRKGLIDVSLIVGTIDRPLWGCTLAQIPGLSNAQRFQVDHVVDQSADERGSSLSSN